MLRSVFVLGVGFFVGGLLFSSGVSHAQPDGCYFEGGVCDGTGNYQCTVIVQDGVEYCVPVLEMPVSSNILDFCRLPPERLSELPPHCSHGLPVVEIPGVDIELYFGPHTPELYTWLRDLRGRVSVLDFDVLGGLVQYAGVEVFAVDVESFVDPRLVQILQDGDALFIPAGSGPAGLLSDWLTSERFGLVVEPAGDVYLLEFSWGVGYFLTEVPWDDATVGSPYELLGEGMYPVLSASERALYLYGVSESGGSLTVVDLSTGGVANSFDLGVVLGGGVVAAGYDSISGDHYVLYDDGGVVTLAWQNNMRILAGYMEAVELWSAPVVDRYSMVSLSVGGGLRLTGSKDDGTYETWVFDPILNEFNLKAEGVGVPLGTPQPDSTGWILPVGRSYPLDGVDRVFEFDNLSTLVYSTGEILNGL